MMAGEMVVTTVRPARARSRRSTTTFSAVDESKPELGSSTVRMPSNDVQPSEQSRDSRKRMDGSVISSMPILALLRSPPEIPRMNMPPTRVSAHAVSFRSAIVRSTAADVVPASFLEVGDKLLRNGRSLACHGLHKYLGTIAKTMHSPGRRLHHPAWHMLHAAWNCPGWKGDRWWNIAAYSCSFRRGNPLGKDVQQSRFWSNIISETLEYRSPTINTSSTGRSHYCQQLSCYCLARDTTK